MIRYIVGPLLLMFLYRYVFYDLIQSAVLSPKLDDIAGKRVLVTGASSGIGQQIAIHYCNLGAKLVITARNRDSLQKLKQKCADKYSNNDVHFVSADMNISADVRKVAKFTLKQFDKKLDHLILNHITPAGLELFDGDMDRARMVTQVNFLSYLDLTSQLFPALKGSNASLVVISSFAGLVPQPFTSLYSGTKHALEGFYGGLRGELKVTETPISVSVVNYGLIDTEGYQSVKDKLKGASAYPPDEAALKAVQIAQSKARDLFYPWWMRPVATLRVFFPNWLEWLGMEHYNLDNIFKSSKSSLFNSPTQ